jgi:signal transduction histidine kinase
VKGDRLELLRVFNNLIGNALKFTEEGQVEVSIEQKDDEIVILISDTGPGVSEAERPFLFQRFQQGAHHKQGSGLGLYLSNYIVTAHGGKISLQCGKDQGSCFVVHLPI